MTLTSVFRCPDGTEFPVTWEQPDDVLKTWRWDQEHQPEPMKPLELAFGKFTRPGAARAFAEAEVPIPALFRGGRIANGFLFTPPQEDAVLPADEQAALHAAVERLIEREGGVWRVWERFCLPRIEASALSLGKADVSAPFAEIGELLGYGMRMTHVAGSFSLFAPIKLKFSEFAKEIGVDGERLFVELSQGYPNATLEGNAALWELAQLANRTPTVPETLLETEPEGVWEAIQALAGGQHFVQAFEAYLARYGCRAGTWSLSSPTWQEDPASPLGLIARIVQERPPAQEVIVAEGARRREAARRQVEERLAGDEPVLARFRKLAEPLEYYIPIREARAYWQLTLTGIFRGLLLQRGRRLVELGAIQRPDDVFHLVPEEIEADRGSDLSAEVAERRAEWEFWAQRKPPGVIGGEGMPGQGPAPAGREDGLIRGMGASRGVVTARARVLRDLEGAVRLRQGEVLVCAMSSPPWTPLFAIASGVVTDSGGILSHPAIVAREYGIPCVVGTRIGTEVIRDGAMITVDGDSGTVRVAA